MPPDEKPYRVYKGGRVKGKVPSAPTRTSSSAQRSRVRAAAGGGKRTRFRGLGPIRLKLPRRPGWRRIIVLGLLGLIVLFVIWSVASYFALSSGVSDANKRLDRRAHAALNKQSGLLLSHATNILVLGTDNAPIAGRTGDNHSDSIMLVRADPSKHRIAYLSIPRDIVVPIPGVGSAKINFAMQSGGIPLAIRTVRSLTGLPINHVIEVNFASFKGLIDALGGITVVVPDAVRSNRFDCPYKTATRCQQWQGWRFPKGAQHMNGQQALIYSRDPREPAQPAGVVGLLPCVAPAGRDPGDALEVHVVRDTARRTVQCGLMGEAAHHRPLDVAADRARLGEVPLVDRERPPLPARRRPRQRRHRRTERGQPADDRDVPRPLCTAAPDLDVRARLRARPAAAPNPTSSSSTRSRTSCCPTSRHCPRNRRLGRPAARRTTTSRRRSPSPSLAAAVVGRVEARAFVVDRDREAAPSRVATHRTPRRPMDRARSCRGTPRTDARSGTCTRKSASTQS